MKAYGYIIAAFAAFVIDGCAGAQSAVRSWETPINVPREIFLSELAIRGQEYDGEVPALHDLFRGFKTAANGRAISVRLEAPIESLPDWARACIDCGGQFLDGVARVILPRDRYEAANRFVVEVKWVCATNSPNVRQPAFTVTVGVDTYSQIIGVASDAIPFMDRHSN